MGNRLDDALLELENAGLTHRRGVAPDAVYTFKHALVQDAAYASLLRRNREHIHAELAGLLESRFPETSALHPELLAHHLTEAGLAPKKASDTGNRPAASRSSVPATGRRWHI